MLGRANAAEYQHSDLRSLIMLDSLDRSETSARVRARVYACALRIPKMEVFLGVLSVDDDISDKNSRKFTFYSSIRDRMIAGTKKKTHSKIIRISPIQSTFDISLMNEECWVHLFDLTDKIGDGSNNGCNRCPTSIALSFTHAESLFAAAQRASDQAHMP